MARINIEECWWSDPRRDLLRRLLGTETQDQVVIRAWRLAQEFWVRGQLIPWNTFSALEGAHALLGAGLAQLRAGPEITSKSIQVDSKLDPSELQVCFVYVRGSSEYLSWAREQRLGNSLGGKKSAQRERDAQGRLKKKSKSTPSQTKSIQVSDSGSDSDSVSDSDSGNLFAQGSSNPDAGKEDSPLKEGNSGGNDQDGINSEGPSPTALTWRSYRDAYRKKYGEAPLYNAKIGGQFKSFVSRVPKEEAPQIAAFYLTHKDQFYVKSMHPVGLLLRDAEKLRTEWVTGRQMTITQARQSEQKSANVEAMKSYLAKKGIMHG